MNSFENSQRWQPHLKFPADATESQVLIALGEETLERVHQVSHRIEEHVHQLLNDSAENFCSFSPNQADHFLSNRPTEDVKEEAKGAVDNRQRRW